MGRSPTRWRDGPLGPKVNRVSDEAFRVGTELAAALPSTSRSSLKAIDQRAMDLASRDAELRAALFRFVDVVPACRSLDDLARHLTGFLGEVDEPTASAPGRDADRRLAGRPGRAGRGRRGRRQAHGAPLHRRREPAAALGVLREALERGGVATSVDLLGEATVTAAEADRYAARCDDALRVAAQARARCRRTPTLERDGLGPIPRVNLSVKVSALTPLLRPDAPERGERDAAARLRRLLRHARELGAHLHIDMESFDTREAITELVARAAGRARVRATARAPGIVLQAYLRDSPAAPRAARSPGPRTHPPRAPAAPSAWSRAPTGTTRSSRPPSTAGRRRSSRTGATATATSRR